MPYVMMLKEESKAEGAELTHACFPLLPSSLPLCSKGRLLMGVIDIRDACLTVIYLNTSSFLHISHCFNLYKLIAPLYPV